MNNTNSISFKAARIVARLFIPILWPVRFLIVMPTRWFWNTRLIRKLRYWIAVKKHNFRLRRAKRVAIERNAKTGKKQFGIKIGTWFRVWDRSEVMAQSKYFSKKLGKPFDYRKFTVFWCESGKITMFTTGKI